MIIIRLKNNALDNLTSFEGSANLGDMVLVSSATASASASIEFTLGDYKEYKFFFVNISPQTNGTYFQMNLSIDNGSNYNVTKTSSAFEAIHTESNSLASLRYSSFANADLAQSTANQDLTEVIPQNAGEEDSSASGILQLFNPASSVYVKHYISNFNQVADGGSLYSWETFKAGYANTVSPLTNIRFSMSSGNIDDGKILMFGLN